ncbi:hypothetical protein PHACT_12660 [Pseudohongiella acticola]|uniref:Uncharacterized protein n=1 Tax=Pseudohongiella acticola TaxID=1524254 RepID=A0A1E8CGA6_9GAMM|nr:hypothetical protein [Pseudohongiella acticola]OFE11402.1 hypothetical protein PHACT_12660 [Pseudohongiella acticola]
MSRTKDRVIICQALDHPGLLTTNQMKFVMKLSRQPSHWRLSPAQTEWLYQIARERLNLQLATPAIDPVVDYRSRACA